MTFCSPPLPPRLRAHKRHSSRSVPGTLLLPSAILLSVEGRSPEKKTDAGFVTSIRRAAFGYRHAAFRAGCLECRFATTNHTTSAGSPVHAAPAHLPSARPPTGRKVSGELSTAAPTFRAISPYRYYRLTLAKTKLPGS